MCTLIASILKFVLFRLQCLLSLPRTQNNVRGATKRRIRELRIFRMRHKRTESRKKKARGRRRFLLISATTSFGPKHHSPKGVPIRTAYNLTFPRELNFDGNLDETLKFFSQFRQLVHEHKPRIIRIDHSALMKVSPAAALVLIAEIVRAVEILRNCQWFGNGAANPEARQLLGEVGYWDYFEHVKWEKSETESRQFLHHKTGNRTSGSVVKELIEHFLPALPLPQESKKILYPALIECMDNVMKHAYSQHDEGRLYFRRWWLLGFRDLKTLEVFFCFYDQGVGIPQTIRVRFKDRIPLLSMSDSQLIVKAVVEGHYSSTKDPTRGRGLPKLKSFIDVAKAGELMIVSHKSRCTFFKNTQPLEVNAKAKFGGTLIVWRLQN
jgi:hypothetical protein